MKDFNDNFNKIEVSSKLDKVIKDSIKEGYRKKEKSKKYLFLKRGAVAAILVCTVTTCFMSSFPTYAKNIPIIKDIFSVLSKDEGIYKNYKEESNELNITKNSKGASITINDAVFDGRNISLTYTVESNRDLGEEITIASKLQLKDNRESGSYGDMNFIKVGENTYVGQENITIADFVSNPSENISFKLSVNSISSVFDHKNGIKGEWDFNLSLNAVNTKKVQVGKSTEKEGVKLNLNSLSISPINMFIDYSQSLSEEASNKYDKAYIEFLAKDDLGNVYTIHENGAIGDNSGNLESSITLEKLKEGASKLIISPRARLIVYGEPKKDQVEIVDEIKNEKSFKETEVYECIEMKEVILDDIIIEP